MKCYVTSFYRWSPQSLLWNPLDESTRVIFLLNIIKIKKKQEKKGHLCWSVISRFILSCSRSVSFQLYMLMGREVKVKWKDGNLD